MEAHCLRLSIYVHFPKSQPGPQLTAKGPRNEEEPGKGVKEQVYGMASRWERRRRGSKIQFLVLSERNRTETDGDNEP